MPFKSKAQQRFMFAAQARGDIKPGTAERFAKATPSIKKLPEYKSGGGMVGSSVRTGTRPSQQYGGPVYMYGSQGGPVYKMRPDEFQDRYPAEQYGGPVNMQAAHGGRVGKDPFPEHRGSTPEFGRRGSGVAHIGKSEMIHRHPDNSYGAGPSFKNPKGFAGPVDMNAAEGGEVDPHAVELLKRVLARKGGNMAYGGTADGDEALDQHPEEEYGGPVDESMMEGGEVTCPNCGHRYAHGGNIGRHMQPGFQDMDPEKADMEADMNLGRALMQKHRGF